MPGTAPAARATHVAQAIQASVTTRVALIALVAFGVVGCDREPGLSETQRLLQRGREVFVAGGYAEAREFFRRAAALDADNHEAALGSARSYHKLHEYEAARTHYEEALELEPGDALTWQGYIEALYWGGVHEGNGERLGRLLDIAPSALLFAPDNVAAYEYVLRTAAELNRLGDYLSILERVAVELPDASVPQIELTKMRIEDARRARNAAAGSPAYGALSEAVEDFETALRRELEAGSGAGSSEVDTPPAESYKMALGYELLGDPDRADQWLDVLDRTAPGRRMATPMRYERFLGEWVSTFDQDPETRIGVAESWLPRFEPEWATSGDHYRAILGLQFDVMVAAARAALASAGTGGDADDNAAIAASVSEPQADRLARVGRELARTDTQQGAARFVETVSVLARVPSHYVTAVRVADDGIEALRESRPGLLHPRTPDNEREEIQLRYIAVLMQLQGQALHNLGRGDEAEQVLREAIALYPVSASYAVLGGLLLDDDRVAEAFDLFVAALARGFTPTELALEEQTRASALEAAALIGASPEVVDQAVAFAAEIVEEERRLSIVADPLDLPAPDFELTDTRGGAWRLSELAGNVVVLNYWATWCGPCIAEMPYYQSLVDEYAGAGDVVFLAISTDSDPAVVAPFIDESGYTFNVLIDDGSAGEFDVSGVPASVLVGKDGRIKYRTSGFPGPQRYLQEMRLRIEALRADGS